MEELLRIVKTKLRLSDNTEDEILKLYLEMACSFVNNLRQYTPTIDAVEPKYKYVTADLAISAYLKEGAEGEVSHSENGISRTYDSSSYPADLVSKIIPKVICYANTKA